MPKFRTDWSAEMPQSGVMPGCAPVARKTMALVDRNEPERISPGGNMDVPDPKVGMSGTWKTPELPELAGAAGTLDRRAGSGTESGAAGGVAGCATGNSAASAERGTLRLTGFGT